MSIILPKGLLGEVDEKALKKLLGGWPEKTRIELDRVASRLKSLECIKDLVSSIDVLTTSEITLDGVLRVRDDLSLTGAFIDVEFMGEDETEGGMLVGFAFLYGNPPINPEES